MDKRIGKTITSVASVVTGVALTLATCEGIKDVRENIENLNTQIECLNKEIDTKDKEIKELKNNLDDKDINIEYLEEERRMLYNQIEDLKKEISSSKVNFNSSNLKQKSGVDAKRLNEVLEGTALYGLGDAYVQAEKQYGVNALFLTALTAQESGWGSSNRARTQNNLSGYAVYSKSSEGRSFDSKTSSILATAKLLSKDYLNTNGKYYKGTDIHSVNETYCPNDDYLWANNITSIAKELMIEINSL